MRAHQTLTPSHDDDAAQRTDNRTVSIGRVVVIGAGAVGLSTAWFLQRDGVDVCVIDRKEVAAGSSSGNAGWLSPSLVLPLAEPALLRSACR